VKDEWGKWLIAALISLLAAFFAVQWQQAESQIGDLNREMVQLETVHDRDVARLDESNRNRRNDLADLEERVAILEERTR